MPNWTVTYKSSSYLKRAADRNRYAQLHRLIVTRIHSSLEWKDKFLRILDLQICAFTALQQVVLR